jgi:hypothetical protein
MKLFIELDFMTFTTVVHDYKTPAAVTCTIMT